MFFDPEFISRLSSAKKKKINIISTNDKLILITVLRLKLDDRKETLIDNHGTINKKV